MLGQLIARHARFDQLRPRVDPAGDVCDGRVVVGAEKLGYPQAAPAMMAKDENMLVIGQLGEPAGYLSHGDMNAALDLADGDFIRFPDIKDDLSRFLCQSGSFGDLNFQGCFHVISCGATRSAISTHCKCGQFAVDAVITDQIVAGWLNVL
jgi:hypothetical protein